MLYAVRGKEGSWFEYVFQSPNELEPYNFLKQVLMVRGRASSTRTAWWSPTRFWSWRCSCG